MHNTRKLIIIDDEEDLLDLMEYHFEREGYEVHAFDRATSAWEFMSNIRPDIILCDWMMPEMTGIDFCKKVKSNLSLADIPFVMVTCRSEKSAMQTALSEGASAFIRKPILMPDLVKQISEVVSLKRG